MLEIFFHFFGQCSVFDVFEVFSEKFQGYVFDVFNVWGVRWWVFLLVLEHLDMHLADIIRQHCRLSI